MYHTMLNKSPNFNHWITFVGYSILLLMFYGLLIYLLKFTLPQIAEFIVQVSPMDNLTAQEAFDHAFNYAIAIDAGIFLLTAIGQSNVAKWFMGVQMITQLLFMHRWDEFLKLSHYGRNLESSAAWRLFLGSIFICIMAPLAIWFLSEQIKTILTKLKAILEQIRAKTKQTETTVEQKLKSFSNALANSEANGAKLEQKLKDLEMLFAESEQEKAEREQSEDLEKELGSGPEKKPFKCRHCEDTFKTFRALAGHMKKHSGFKEAENGKELVTL